MIVVDTNVLGYFYFAPSRFEPLKKLRIAEGEWLAPQLWKSEFLNIASLYIRKGLVSVSDVSQAFQNASEMVMTFEIHSEYQAILELTRISACSAYDCEFVALAEKFESKLLTYDKQILQSFPNVAVSPEDFLALEQ